MEIYKVVGYLSMIAWAHAAVRQYKNRFFPFFLVLALADPIRSFVMAPIFKHYHNGYYVIVVFLYFVAVLNAIKSAKMGILSTIAALLVLSPTLFVDIELTSFGVVVFTFATLLLVLREAVSKFIINEEFNLFIWMIVFYMITMCTKFIPFIFDAWRYVEFFVFMGFVQVFIGIFFIIFTENSPAMKIKLKNKLAFEREDNNKARA